MRSHYCLLLVMALVALVMEPAGASTITIRDAFGGEKATGAPQGVYGIGTGARPRGTMDSGATTRAFTTGKLDLDIDFGGGFQPFDTYCIEPTQSIGFGLFENDPAGLSGYSLVDLTSLPQITSQEAEFIEILWANEFSDSSTGVGAREKSSAFQLLLWETFLDNSMSGTALTTGAFRLSTGHPFTSGAYSPAQTWINNILGANPVWTDRAKLAVVTHPDSQDFLIEVPEPGVAGMMAIGMWAVIRRRPRRA